MGRIQRGGSIWAKKGFLMGVGWEVEVWVVGVGIRGGMMRAIG